MNYKETDILNVKENACKLFSADWAILTAGGVDSFNSMTVSWGFMGELWGKHSALVFIRPQRYTYEFAEKSDYFTLSFYADEYKDKLKIFGSKSGRDINKYEETGIAALTHEGWVYTDKSKLVLLCKKIASQDLKPEGFLSPDIEPCYSNGDYHKVFIGEIVKTLEADF